MKCPQCGYEVEKGEFRCPRCFKSLLKPGGCDGSCSKCNLKENCGK